jgi:cadmium resistance protein CadD (predicted permease)
LNGETQRVTDTSALLVASAACTAFVATNLDNATLLLAFASTAKPSRIFVAFAGVGIAIVGTSLLLSLLASAVNVPARYFGLVPLFIGVYQLLKNAKTPAAAPVAPATAYLTIMVVSFLACSVDNLTVYVAMLVRYGPGYAALICGILCILTILTGLAGVLAGNRMLRPVVQSRSFAPAVIACVGLTMLVA